MTQFTVAQLTAACEALGLDSRRLDTDVREFVIDMVERKEITDEGAVAVQETLMLGVLDAALEWGADVPGPQQAELFSHGATAYLLTLPHDERDETTLMRGMELVCRRLERTASQVAAQMAEIEPEDDPEDELDAEHVPEDSGPILAVQGAAAYVRARLSRHHKTGDELQGTSDPLRDTGLDAERVALLRHAQVSLTKAAAEAVYDLEDEEQD